MSEPEKLKRAALSTRSAPQPTEKIEEKPDGHAWRCVDCGKFHQPLTKACRVSGRLRSESECPPWTPTPPKSLDDALDIYVPGNWTCPTCNYVLSSQTIFMQSGSIGCTREQVMDITGEVCPNDGEPMRRVTWRERADDNQKWGLSLMEDIIAATHAEHLPGALAAIKERFAPSAPEAVRPDLQAIVEEMQNKSVLIRKDSYGNVRAIATLIDSWAAKLALSLPSKAKP